MKKLAFKAALLLAATLALPLSANALVASSLPGGSVVSAAPLNYFGGGPISVAPGITWSSTNDVRQGGSVAAYSYTYGFGGNGAWEGLTLWGLNDSHYAFSVTDTMTFKFDAPVAGVGGLLNWVDASIRDTPTQIAVWDSSMNLIESQTLTADIGSGTNQGSYVYFSESSADISYFTLSDNYIAIAGLTVLGDPSVSPVPEPETYALMLAGLAVVGAAARRRKSA